MSDVRTVYIDAEDVVAIEAGGYALIREEQNGPGIRLMALALKWKETGQPVFAELTERETRGALPAPRADGSEWPPRPRSVSFACSADDIDESAGLAGVVELRGYSRKVVCE